MPPLPLDTGQNDTCAFVCCTHDGHVACRCLEDHYSRLVAAALDLILTDPDKPEAVALHRILNESTPAIQ